MRVYVPSYGRAGRVTSLSFLRREDVTLVVRPSQEAGYHAAYPDIEILVLPIEDMHVGRTRQWLIDTIDGTWVMCDDDLTHRGDIGLDEALSDLDGLDFALGGVGHKYLSKVGEHDVLRDLPVWFLFVVCAEKMCGVDLQSLPIHEDIAMNIWALTHGGTATTHACAVRNAYDPVGGVSGYRNTETLSGTIDEMVRRYPQWCGRVETEGLRIGEAGPDMGCVLWVSWHAIRTGKLRRIPQRIKKRRRRRTPADLKTVVVLAARNPKRGKAAQRFEVYYQIMDDARTLQAGDAIDLGVTFWDLVWDHDHGFVELEDRALFGRPAGWVGAARV